MTPSQPDSVLELFAHGMYITSMWIAQALVPMITLGLALRAL